MMTNDSINDSENDQLIMKWSIDIINVNDMMKY